jgi:hypothetical protein
LDQASSTLRHPPKPGHIAQRVNAREFAYSTCSTLQPLVARQCRGLSFGLESTAEVLLTKSSTRTSWASRFYWFCRKKRADERTRTAYPCSSYECAVRRCRGLQGLAKPAFLSSSLCTGLLDVAPYCAPGGVRVVSYRIRLKSS